MCLKVPRLDFVRQRFIQFKVCAVTRLRLVEPQVYQRARCCSCKHKAKFAAKVELVGVEKIGQGETPHDVERILAGETESDRLDTQTRGRHLGQNCKGNGADTNVVEEGVRGDIC